MELVLDLPMLPDYVQQARWSSSVRAKASDAVDHFVPLLPALLQGDAALQLKHLAQPRPITVPHQRRAGGQAAVLDPAVPAVHRLRGGYRLCQRVRLLKDQVDILGAAGVGCP